jgi:hypothetical protein
LQKFKNLNVYTYTYKKEFNEDAKFNINMSEEDYINRMKKLKELQCGFIADELKQFSKKTTKDFIQDDQYIISVVGQDVYNKF